MFPDREHPGSPRHRPTYAVGVISPADDEVRPLSALPSRGARVLAFVSILVGGLAGGLIGHGLVAVQCDGDCALPRGLGIMLGALPAAGGTAIVAVLALRAIGEWREMTDRS